MLAQCCSEIYIRQKLCQMHSMVLDGNNRGDVTAKHALSVAEGTPRPPSTRQENKGIHRRDAEDAEATRRRIEGILTGVTLYRRMLPLPVPKPPQSQRNLCVLCVSAVNRT